MLHWPSIFCLISFVFCLLAHVFYVDTLHTEEGLDMLFRQRTQSDWEKVWHHEAHSRCRDKLVRHLYWACEKDIYRMTRRNRKRTDEAIDKLEKPELNSIWSKTKPIGLLQRSRRTNAPSITDECCTRSGCTWEEYAEYCPSNKRKNHYSKRNGLDSYY